MFLPTIPLRALHDMLLSSSSLKGVLDNAGFPAVVTAHFVPVEGQQRPRTTILIKFSDEVVSYIFYANFISPVALLWFYASVD